MECSYGRPVELLDVLWKPVGKEMKLISEVAITYL
jgi:hypothetical protein